MKSRRTKVTVIGGSIAAAVLLFSLVKILLSDCTEIFREIENGNLSKVKELTSNGVNLDCRGDFRNTPLIFACWHGRKDIVGFLVKEGADVDAANKSGMTPLSAAAKKGYADIVRFLLKNGAEPGTSSSGSHPLHSAAMSGDPETVAVLVKHTGTVSVRTEERDSDELFSSIGNATPLHFARSAGAAEVLIKHGADVNARTTSELTPLHGAARHGRAGVARMLVKHGADVNARSTGGKTPLHFAAGCPSYTIVKLLIQNGAKVNARNEHNGTPLYDAVTSDALECVKMLIEHGAKIDIVNDRWDRTPLAAARFNAMFDDSENVRKIYQLLRQKKAQREDREK